MGLRFLSVNEEDESQVLKIGSGCSGIDIWHHCIKASLEIFEMHYGMEVPTVSAEFAAECEKSKREFLKHQFPELKVLLSDVKLFDKAEGTLVKNVLTEEMVALPWVAAYGAGFSCKSASKQNQNRTANTC